MTENDKKKVELYKKHRPTKFSDLLGQDHTVKMLVDFGRRNAMPHFLLFTGPAGCGKTTIARILKNKLRCGDLDFEEKNSANFRGIEMVRAIQDQIHFNPIDGACRIWLLDEVHQFSGDAQEAFLKVLEDTPEHAYFFLCTTDPQKLKASFRSRATEIKVKLLNDKDMGSLVEEISNREKFNLSDDVRDKIVESAEGSPRKALVLLNQIIGLEDEASQLASVSAGVATSQVIDLARALVGGKVRWPAISKILKGIEEEPESVRRMILGYCSSVMLNNGSERVFKIIASFERNFFDSGRAGLVAACWEVVHGG